ncbi:ankyrin repeat domain-containing protein [Collimonas pratensis]|nr:ankyrin repeat domain-containing protein [Collimonas pratensis]
MTRKFTNKTIAIVGVVAFAAVVVSTSPVWTPLFAKGSEMTGFKRYPPEHFFTDPKQIALGKAIYDGDLAAVVRLIPGTDLNKPGINGGSPILYALQETVPVEQDGTSERFAILSALVKAGANPDPYSADSDKPTALDFILLRKSNFAFRALLDGGLDPNHLRHGEEPLIFSVASDDLMPSLKLLVDRRVDVDKRDSLGRTAIDEALASYQFDAIDYLLAHGANPKNVDRLGTSFAWAVQVALNHVDPNWPRRPRLLTIRDRLVALGVIWPPTTPKVLREQMRAHGETPIPSPVLDK